MARDDKWVSQKLKALQQQPPPAQFEENLRRAVRHAQGKYTVVKTDDKE